MIWGGVAETHMKRNERIQHEFLIWQCARCKLADVTLGYDELIEFFGLSTLAARREQHHAMFLRNIHRHSIDSSFLLSKFPLVAPTRLLRNRSVFHVPYARGNTVNNGLFFRITKISNAFLAANGDGDVWLHSQKEYRSRVAAYVRPK